jgi:carbonyl reductase 1
MRKVLITGSNRGLGLELAKQLLAYESEFSAIIMTARNPSLGAEALASLGPNPRLSFIQLDITCESSILAARDEVLRLHGHIDVLVNNAAIYDKSATPSHLKIASHLATNVYGTMNVTQAFLPLLEPNGHIVNLSSRLGETPFLQNPDIAKRLLDRELSIEGIREIAREFAELGEDWKEKGWSLDGKGVYGMTKALINAYTRVMHKKLRGEGKRVRINAVSPGVVKTEMGGPYALLEVDEGASLPLMLTRDVSEVSGLYFSCFNVF